MSCAPEPNFSIPEFKAAPENFVRTCLHISQHNGTERFYLHYELEDAPPLYSFNYRDPPVILYCPEVTKCIKAKFEMITALFQKPINEKCCHYKVH
jgi:hypothetical protein